MLDIINKDDYKDSSVHKNLIIEMEDGSTLDNKNVVNESMSISEILMEDNQLHFGRCNSSQFGITLGNVDASLKDKVIKPYLVVGGNEINKSAEGSQITVTDSGNYPLIEFREDGYIIQDGTPAPDAPIDIKGLGDDGNIEVLTTGKNLFGATLEDFQNGTTSGAGKELWFKLKPNTQYTCSSNTPMYDSATKATNIWFNGAPSTTNGVNNDNPKTTTTDDEGMLRIVLRTSELTTIFNDYWIQLEEGSQATNYEPYQSSSATIPIDSPLYEGDYIEYFADGSGQIVRKYERVVYDGSDDEAWNYFSANNYVSLRPQIKAKTRSVNIYSDYYMPAKSFNVNYILENEMQINHNGWIIIGDKRYSTLEDFKTWLQSNPITVVYELAEPIVTPLTAEQVAEIEKLYTFESTTNLFAESNTSIKYRYNKALPLGVFTVKEVPRLSQVSHKQITALDNMHKIDRDVTEWYNNLTFPTTQKAFRDSFFAYIGIEQVETTLPFDSLVLDNPFGNMVSISGRVIIEGICELNARFGHCDREGRFDYIKLNTNPSDDEILDLEKTYINCAYDDFVTQTIDRVIIVDEYGTQVATSDNNVGSNTYVINNNYLLYGKTVDELRSLGNQFIELVKDISYTPLAIENKGLPYVELGDNIRATTKDGEINSFIFNRTLKGVQALRDNYSAEGEEYLLNDLNSIQTQIDNVNRKTERLKIEVTATAEGLESKVSNDTFTSYQQQTDKSIISKVSKGDVSSQLSVESEQVTITGNRFVVDSDNLDITANGIVTCDKLKATNADVSGTITSSNATITGGSIEVIGEDAEDSKVIVRNENDTLNTLVAPSQISLNSGDDYLTTLGAGVQNSLMGTGGLLIKANTRMVGLGLGGLNFGYSNSGTIDAQYTRTKALCNGNITANGGELRSTSANAFRSVYGNYGFFIRHDGSNVYFMFTNSSDQYGSYNSLRPLSINNITGAVNMGNGLTTSGLSVTGGVQVNGNGTAIKLIKSGTTVLTSTTTSYALFTAATLKSWYSGYSPTGTAILVSNGDGDANGAHFDNCTYLPSDQTWRVPLDRTVNGNARINYVVIMW